ncbi:porin [Qingshengfaniella alkalisoli]|uniref:Porin n=1 Tax=Qingshengfaniella alkalisoli TaxID=2599296 RepID=A0A5B8J202_9RHOB|nr:porin [Qingshengfaniella alkalisoli]QDY68260.1 porin [Qingshengfaniella alkalisoli]
MKKILLASSALVLTAGYAAADVTVSGDGRMGIVYAEDGYANALTGKTKDWSYNSRIRIKFAASGETDGGLAFGGSVRADHYDDDQGTKGTAGDVFISGGFGKLSMGDVDGGAEKAIGDLAEIGYTCLACLNETTYLFGGNDPSALYEYAYEGLILALGVSDDEEYSVGVGYDGGMWSVGLGYENVPEGSTISLIDNDETGLTADVLSDEDLEQVFVGGSVTFSDITLKGVYGVVDADDWEIEQYGISAEGTWGATTVAAYWRALDTSDIMFDGDGDGFADEEFGKIEIYGIGAEYDLGGGASVAGGIASVDDNTIGDIGLKFSF